VRHESLKLYRRFGDVGAHDESAWFVTTPELLEAPWVIRLGLQLCKTREDARAAAQKNPCTVGFDGMPYGFRD
jgi:hypothetical protein